MTSFGEVYSDGSLYRFRRIFTLEAFNDFIVHSVSLGSARKRDDAAPYNEIERRFTSSGFGDVSC
jgi:hypothetical protein